MRTTLVKEPFTRPGIRRWAMLTSALTFLAIGSAFGQNTTAPDAARDSGTASAEAASPATAATASPDSATAGSGTMTSESVETGTPTSVADLSATAELASGGRTVESLQLLLTAIQAKRSQFEALKAKFEAETADVLKADLGEKLKEASQELEQLRLEFRKTAAGVDITPFVPEQETPFSWEEKLGEVLEPILAEIEAATADSKQRAAYREEFLTQQERLQVATNALENVKALREDAKARLAEARRRRAALRNDADADPDTVEAAESTFEAVIELEEALKSQQVTWEELRTVAKNRARSAELQLQALQKEDFLTSSTSFLRRFVRERGLNPVMGVGAAALFYFAVRLLLYLWRKSARRSDKKKLGSRVMLLAVNGISVLGALLAMIAVFSAAGDFFLLGIVVLILIGAAWAGVKMLPQYVETVKLMLNIGTVREDERLIYDGITWNVSSLGFWAILENPLLDNGTQAMPVRDLVGMHSRPWCEGEALFPCERGEWVSLSDGRTGRTLAQNPGHVVLEELGGGRITYQTADFLAQAPRNLSKGFRVETRFGIDYAHQADSTTTIPETMQQRLIEGLGATFGAANIREVDVSFALAGSSALEYEVDVDVTGAVAHEYEEIEFALQRILVDACNDNGWTIPFTQVTLHQAAK